MPAGSYSVSPLSQTTVVGIYTGDFLVNWLATPGGPTPQAFTLSDAGGGGTFNTGASFSVDWNGAAFTFQYKNVAAGTYTITIHAGAGPLSGAPNVTCTVIVNAASTYSCTDTSTMLPFTFLAGDFSHKLTFPLPSPSSGKWWGGTLELKFSIDTAFPPFTPPGRYYLGIDVKHADNAANIGAFYMETGNGPILKYPLIANITDFDQTLVITDQFLDACTFGAGGNLVVTIDASSLLTISGHTFNLRNVTITQANLCLRNVTKGAIAGSDLAPVPVVHSYAPQCNANNSQTAAGALSSPSLSGVKYQVIGSAAVDIADLWSYIQKPADVTLYEADGVLRHITVTIPVPPNFMPFRWLSCTLNLKGTYTPDHSYGELETTNDYPLYQFVVRGWSDRLNAYGDFADQSNGANELFGESDFFDGRYASDFSTDGIDIYLGPISLFQTLASSNADGVGLGGAFKFYIMARHLATDGIHTGDALLDWGSFDFSSATFSFQACVTGAGGTYDATKTADFGPVFSTTAPPDQIGSLVAHFTYSSVVWQSVPAGQPDQTFGPIESWVSGPQPSTVYPGFHTYSLSRGAGRSDGHLYQFPWGDRPNAVTVGGTLYNWTLKTVVLASLTESYCGCTGPVLNPHNLQDAQGNYHEVGLAGLAVAYRRSDFVTPGGTGWAAASQIAPPSGRAHFDPKVVRDDRQTVLICYSRQVVASGAWDGAYIVQSNDDGSTWEAPVLAIPSGKHPTIAVGYEDGTFATVIVAAYVGLAGGPGVITAKKQNAGDVAFGDAFNLKDSGADLVAADDTFHIQQAHEGSLRWLLHVRINGEAATSTWESYDDCVTWKRVA